jgi:trk system potassium uptake protein TrkA
VTEPDLLENEGLSRSDALVTLTGFDELNMIVSAYASSQGVPQVITKMGHTQNRSVIDSLSLGSVISPRELVANNIVRYVRAMENQTGAAITVHSIADGQVEAMEFLVDEHTKFCGKPLKEIKLKPNVLLVGIAHGGSNEIPNGDSSFNRGDVVVVVTNGGHRLRQLNDIFA